MKVCNGIAPDRRQTDTSSAALLIHFQIRSIDLCIDYAECLKYLIFDYDLIKVFIANCSHIIKDDCRERF